MKIHFQYILYPVLATSIKLFLLNMGVDLSYLEVISLFLLSVSFYFLCLLILTKITDLFFSLFKIKATSFYTYSFILIIYGVIDGVVYKIYSMSLSLPLLHYFYLTLGNPKEVLNNIPIINFIALPILAFLFTLLVQKLKKIQYYFSLKKTVCLALFFNVFFNLFHAYFDHYKNDYYVAFFEHFPHYKLFTINRGKKRLGIPRHTLTHEEIVQDISIVPKRYYYPKENVECSLKNRTSKIFYLYVDTLRSDMLNPDNMPLTYKHIKEKKFDIFENFISLASSTSTGLFSIFYGIPGFMIHTFTQNEITPYFFQALKQKDFSINIHNSADLAGTIFLKNVFLGLDIPMTTKGEYDFEKDQNITENFINTKSTKNNEFHFLLYNCAHNYCYPPDFQEEFAPSEVKNYFKMSKNDEPGVFFNRYKNSIRYVDTLLDQALTHIFTQYKSDDIYIVISSDHGEAFNHTRNNNWGHGNNFSDDQARAPLAIFSKRSQAKTFKHLVTSEDIFKTTMDQHFVCNNKFKDLTTGQNIYSTKSRYPLIYSNYSKVGIRENADIMEITRELKFRYYDQDFHKVKSKFQKNGFAKYLKIRKHFSNR